MGNLAFYLSCNSLWVNTFYRQSKCRLFGFHGFTNFGESAWMFSFLRCEAVLLATMILITEYCWLKMLSLSVNRWGFTDKLFKFEQFVRRKGRFPDKSESLRQDLHQPPYFLGNFFCSAGFLLPVAGPILYLDKNSWTWVSFMPLTSRFMIIVDNNLSQIRRIFRK